MGQKWLTQGLELGEDEVALECPLSTSLRLSSVSQIQLFLAALVNRRTAHLKPALVTEFKATQGNLVNYCLKIVSKKSVDGQKVHVLTDSTRKTGGVKHAGFCLQKKPTPVFHVEGWEWIPGNLCHFGKPALTPPES